MIKKNIQRVFYNIFYEYAIFYQIVDILRQSKIIKRINKIKFDTFLMQIIRTKKINSIINKFLICNEFFIFR